MKFIFSFLLLTIGVFASAQKAAVFQKDGLAIRGYDPVAFFHDQKPVKGSAEFQTIWNDATWYFASRENLDSFQKDPSAFAPQYGGYCAYGMAEGHKAPTDPDTWTIIEGKLYFNYSNSVKKMWTRDIPGHIRKADENWPLQKDKD